MILKTLQTGLSGNLHDSPSMLLDASGLPHVVWYKDRALHYALFNGLGWELRNQESFVKDATSVFPNSICFDANGWPSIVYGNDDGVMHVLWNGYNWTTLNASGLVLSNESLVVLGATASIEDGDNYVFVIIQGETAESGSMSSSSSSSSQSSGFAPHKELVVLKFTGTIWDIVNRITIPQQENNTTVVKATVASGVIFVFWTGKQDVDSWIGYAVFNPVDNSLSTSGDGYVVSSYGEGTINGLDAISRYPNG